MRTRFWSLILTLFLVTSAWAAPSADVVILPLDLEGDHVPSETEAVTKDFQEALKKLAPSTNFQVSRPADLKTYGYQADGNHPPSFEVAAKIANAYGATHVCYVSLRFQPDYQPETGALAVAGAAQLWVYSASQRKLAIDAPVSLVRVGTVPKGSTDAAAQAVGEELGRGCISDLAYQIVGIARQASQKPPASAASWNVPTYDPATQSKHYKTMLAATKSYQRAVRDQSMVDITTSQAAMTRAWTVLNQQERSAIEKNFPDLQKAMTQVPVYNYGGYYWNGGYSVGYPGYPNY